MEAFQAKQILLKVSCIWNRQVTDDAVQNEWVECLVRVTYEAAVEAVNGYRDCGQHDAPTCGEIYHEARAIDDRAEAERQAKMRRLEDRSRPTPEQMSKIRSIFDTALNRKMK